MPNRVRPGTCGSPRLAGRVNRRQWAPYGDINPGVQLLRGHMAMISPTTGTFTVSAETQGQQNLYRAQPWRSAPAARHPPLSPHFFQVESEPPSGAGKGGSYAQSLKRRLSSARHIRTSQAPRRLEGFHRLPPLHARFRGGVANGSTTASRLCRPSQSGEPPGTSRRAPDGRRVHLERREAARITPAAPS